MLAVFIIILSVVALTIIIAIISNKNRESGKHFANSKENKNDSKNKKKEYDSANTLNIETAIKSNSDNVNSAHDEDELKEKKLREQLGLFDKSIYDNLFTPNVIERGEEYFSDGKISNFSKSTNKYTCKVNGTNQYDVQITFNDENPDIIEEASCNCTYFTRQHKYCKHIYALLYKVKCSQNKEILDNKFAKIASETADMITKAAKDVNKNIDNYNRDVVEQFVKYTKNIHEQLEYWTYHYLNVKTEHGRLNALLCLIKYTSGADSRIDDLMNKMKDTSYADDDYYEDIDDDFDDDDFDDDNEEEDSKTRLLNELAIYQMSNNLFNNKSHKKENFIDYSEQDLADSGLEEWQKDEVRKGNWEPWSFDENNEFEDDDYYSDSGEDDD